MSEPLRSLALEPAAAAAAGPPARRLGPFASAALAVLAAASPSNAQDGMVLNSATAEPYRQRAAEGRRSHDFSPRRPPRSGRFIYGHWTPYDPPDPASIPEGTQTHVIVRGDTLWDLAGRFYDDNLLWPFLWEANSWITFPHWIYPGDVLVVPPLMVVPDGRLQADAQLPGILEGFYPAGARDSVACGHFVGDPNIRYFGDIIAGEADPSPIGFTLDEVVYISVGARDGVLPGDEFAIIHPREHFGVSATERDLQDAQLHHPVTGEKLGEIMAMAGRLKVILLGEEISTAVIEYACDSIEVGFRILPFDEHPIPLVRRKDRERHFNEMPRRGRGFIAWVADRAVAGVAGQLITLDLGSDHGVVPGDVFRIYRDKPYDFFDTEVEHLGDFWDFEMGRRGMKQRRDETEKYVYGRQRPVPVAPPRVIGQVVVLYTEQRTSTARALGGLSEFYAGDRIVYEPVDTGLTAVAQVRQDLVPDVPLSRQPRPLMGEEGEDLDKESHGDADTIGRPRRR